MEKIITRIIEIASDQTASEKYKKDSIGFILRGQISDALNLFANINATSVDIKDTQNRIGDLCSRFGLFLNDNNNRFY